MLDYLSWRLARFEVRGNGLGSKWEDLSRIPGERRRHVIYSGSHGQLK